MTFLIIVIIVLIAVFFVQIGKARELASIVRAEKSEKTEEYEANNFHAGLGLIFMIGFLTLCILSFIYYIPYILGWGPNTAASEHGPKVDYMFNITLFFTSIVFFACQFLLFWFAWKYRGKKGARAKYWSHDERLEMVWMLVPAVVMTFLVVGGLQAWNEVMADVSPDEVAGDDYMEIEATGMQFAWLLRYPGRDHKLGATNFTLIDGTNPLGQDWEDAKNIDDFHPSEIVLPVNKKVRVRIKSRDVLHNFYLPQFRVKMDAVPGIAGYFVFTPTVTTDSMKNRYKKWNHWNIPDKQNTDKKRWEVFDYELACAELCGKGHYSMRRVVRIVTEEEYYDWFDEQESTSHYLQNVRGKENDPFKDETLEFTQLLETKDSIKTLSTQISKLLENASQDQEEALEAAYDNIKEQLHVARTTLKLEDAQEAVRKATRIVSDVMPVSEDEKETEEMKEEVEEDKKTEEEEEEGQEATT